MRQPLGFTMIEVLTVISILGVMMAIAIPSYSSIRNNVALSNDADEIVSALRLSQNNAVTSQGGLNQGVYFTNNPTSRYCMFSVDDTGIPLPTSCPAGSTTYTLGSYGITVTGAPITVLFKRLAGTITANQSIVIGFSGGAQKTIKVCTTGKIFISDSITC